MNTFARTIARSVPRTGTQVRWLSAQTALRIQGGANQSFTSPALLGAAVTVGAIAAATTFGADHSNATNPAQNLELPTPFGKYFLLSEAESGAATASVISKLGTNAAFVFVKPHAVNPKVIALVKEKFAACGIKVTGEGTFDAATIDKNGYIDNHYGAIANKAVQVTPDTLNVPPKGKADFEKMFGVKWDDVIAQGKVYNAKDACEKLGIDGMGLDKEWSKLKRGTNLVKFGGGFYAGKVGDIWVMNGFYMSMRSDYCTPPASIAWMTVEWPAGALSWEDFRGEVLGATNPSEAPVGSVRRTILDDYKKLGLKDKPDTGNNGVHASASPFEALAERMNWTGANMEDDIFGSAMLAAGIPASVIGAWTKDPQVEYEGKKASLFDLLEDMNASDCLAKAIKFPK